MSLAERPFVLLSQGRMACARLHWVAYIWLTRRCPRPSVITLEFPKHHKATRLYFRKLQYDRGSISENIVILRQIVQRFSEIFHSEFPSFFNFYSQIIQEVM